MKVNKLTRRIQIRVTNEEYQHIKDASADFSSVAHYIRSALHEYSDTSAKDKMQQIQKLTDMFEQCNSMLYHTTANLNQAVKHANELSIAGLLTESYFTSSVCSNASATIDSINKLRAALRKIVADATKYNV